MEQTETYVQPHEVLIEQCKKGKKEAFEELYRLYNKAMFNVCMRILNNKEEAEDVLQESFISAFNKIAQFSFKGSFGSWLKRIVINRCLDSVRKRNFDIIPLAERDIADEEPEDEEISYTIEDIKRGITALPDGYRIVLTLYVFEEYSHKKIAEKLGISEGNSKSQYSRAKKKLVEWIKVKGGNDER